LDKTLKAKATKAKNRKMGLNQTKLLLNKGNNEQNKDTTF
jgi:hypothetical protein